MAFEIKDGNTYLGLWFVYPPEDEHLREHPEVPKADLMAVMWRDPEGRHHLQYRFRYYASDHVWDRQDRKSWYQGTASPDKDPADLIDGINAVCAMTAVRNGSSYDHVEMNVTTAEAFCDILTAQPWAHCHVMPKGADDEQVEKEIELLYQDTDGKLGRHRMN